MQYSTVQYSVLAAVQHVRDLLHPVVLQQQLAEGVGVCVGALAVCLGDHQRPAVARLGVVGGGLVAAGVGGHLGTVEAAVEVSNGAAGRGHGGRGLGGGGGVQVGRGLRRRRIVNPL